MSWRFAPFWRGHLSDGQRREVAALILDGIALSEKMRVETNEDRKIFIEALLNGGRH